MPEPEDAFFTATTGGKGSSLHAQMDIMVERLAQLEEFGLDADDLLEPSEWVARITKHLGRAVTMEPAAYRQELVVVGALALAAVESFDRRYP